MKYCPYCGEQLSDDMSFCPKCGKPQSQKKTNGECSNDGQIITAPDNIKSGAADIEQRNIPWRGIIVGLVISIFVAVCAYYGYNYLQAKKIEDSYNHGVELFKSGEYDDAYLLFDSLGDYSNSSKYKLLSAYLNGNELTREQIGEIKKTVLIANFANAKELIYNRCVNYYREKQYDKAEEGFRLFYSNTKYNPI